MDHVTADQHGGANHSEILNGSPERFRVVDGLSDLDRGYVIREWTDGVHRTRSNFKKPFRFWKPVWREQIQRVLKMPATRVLVAHHDTARVQRDGADAGPACLGFLVWTTGRGWPAIHYAFTRHALDGVSWRRRGVMTELVDAAGLGKRVQFTQEGEFMRGSNRQRHPAPMHEPVVAWARRQGMSVAYVPIEEWLRA